jgi:plasmid stabilization system protein ParE
VPITVEILPEAQRMVDEADERWVAEHGFLADNPLLNEILRASDLLRTNPQIGVVVRRGRSEIRRLLLHSGWHIYYQYDGDRQLVEILAVWYASRGSTPPL